MTYTIGIDVGGTFTDVVVAAPDGTITLAKAATTPADQSVGVLDSIARAATALGLAPAALLAITTRIIHGTTAATNALLEGKIARVAMLTTEGHRDIIEMREGLKPERYNLRLPPPAPLVPRALRLSVRERLRHDGTVAIPLDPASLEAALTTLEAERVESVAICFLHSWANPAHEHLAAAAVRARLPDAFVTASAEILPQIKEFERFSTTIANAAVGPVIAAYLRRLESRLADSGFAGTLFVILSHGGVATVAEAIRLAAGTALSGPAGGVAAAVALAASGPVRDLIAFDMGGTSTDIALLRDGTPGLAEGRVVGPARIALPALDIVTLGAGGGSIAQRDRSGLLIVGPASAGAEPGPACYGLGGTTPTVTDANLVLGYLDPTRFLGGARRLDARAATEAVVRLAAELGLTDEATAAGIHLMVNTTMADGVRLATIRRGVDPRGFALLAFGGAAGLHVTAVAAMLGIARVMVPRTASVLSAWGMLNTDPRIELARSLDQSRGVDPAALCAAFAAMEAEGRARLGPFGADATIKRAADMRYGEQVFEIPVPLDGIDWNDPAPIAARFHARHQALYTYAMPDQEVVVTNARASIIGHLAAPPARPLPPAPDAPPIGERNIFLGGWHAAPVYDFTALAPGQALAGPAIVESDTTTVLLRMGETARMDPAGWLDIALP